MCKPIFQKGETQMFTSDDLHYIEAVIAAIASMKLDDDDKLFDACVLSIQNYLNKVHHPWGFFSTAFLLKSNFN